MTEKIIGTLQVKVEATIERMSCDLAWLGDRAMTNEREAVRALFGRGYHPHDVARYAESARLKAVAAKKAAANAA